MICLFETGERAHFRITSFTHYTAPYSPCSCCVHRLECSSRAPAARDTLSGHAFCTLPLRPSCLATGHGSTPVDGTSRGTVDPHPLAIVSLVRSQNLATRASTKIAPNLAHRKCLFTPAGLPNHIEHTPSLYVRDPRRHGRPRRACSPPSLSWPCHVFYSTAHVFSPTRHACSTATHLNLGKTPQRDSTLRYSTSINSLPTREASTPHDAILRIGHGLLHHALLSFFEVCVPHPSLLVVAQAARHVSLPSRLRLNDGSSISSHSDRGTRLYDNLYTAHWQAPHHAHACSSPLNYSG